MRVLLFFTLFFSFSEAADIFIGQGEGGGRCVRHRERVCGVCGLCVSGVYMVCGVYACVVCVCVFE